MRNRPSLNAGIGRPICVQEMSLSHHYRVRYRPVRLILTYYNTPCLNAEACLSLMTASCCVHVDSNQTSNENKAGQLLTNDRLMSFTPSGDRQWP